MKKELEALEIIYEDYNKKSKGWGKGVQALDIIKKALTPPTAVEVCKALSEYVVNGVFYDERSEHFYTIGNNKRVVLAKPVFKKLSCYYTINFEAKSKDITLIGKFYEGLEEKK